MAFVNLPPNLQDMFYALSDRIAKLETGPNQAMYTAEAAQGSSAQASIEAAQALTEAAAANALGVQAINEATVAIAQATYSIQTANAAAAQATSAQYVAGIAQTSANGKNTSNYYTSAPSAFSNNRNGTTPIAGDLWFVVASGTGYVTAQYIYASGTGWGVAPITNTVIANLDAGKINAGTITGIAYNNGSGTFSVSPSGVLVASSATITGNITATSGTFTGTVYASSGTFTGTITSSNATITGGTLTVGANFSVTSAGVLTATSANITGAINATSGSFSGSIYSTNGTIAGFTLTASTITNGSTMTLYNNGDFYTGGVVSSGGGLYSTNACSFGSTLNVTGASTFGATSHSGTMTYAGIATGSGSTMVVVTTGSRVAYTTSSERFKQDIKYIASDGWLDKVVAMKPITYKTSEDFTIDGEPNETQYGFLAEDIYDLGGGLEKTVVLDPLGEPFSLSYDRLTVFLTLAIKELDARLKTLEG